MIVHVFNPSLEFIGVIEEYSSLIWTDRYNKCGDFEIVLPPTPHNIGLLAPDNFIFVDGLDQDRMMIVEDLQLQTDPESGGTLTVTGRSLESILDRRIVWGDMEVVGTIQSGIQNLLNQSIINPSNPKRKISNFIFEWNSSEVLAQITVNTKFMGTSVLDAIESMCGEAQVGYKVTLNDDNQFVFKLYLGADRSYLQDINPYVVFSNDFDNISNTNYVEKMSTYKNATFVKGSDNYSANVEGDEVGLARREVYTDSSGISKDSVGSYIQQLASKGKENLEQHRYTISFDGEANPTAMYQYLRDYKIGDIVEIVNEYGIHGQVRISEYIQSDDSDGFKAYPAFVNIDEISK